MKLKLVCLLLVINVFVHSQEIIEKLNISPKLSLQYARDSFTLKYGMALLQRWNMVLWYKTLEKDAIREELIGGGIEGAFVNVGNMLRYGVYTYFDDISNSVAWSSAPLQYTEWKIRRDPSRFSPWGVRVHFHYPKNQGISIKEYFLNKVTHEPILSTWWYAVPLENKNSSLMHASRAMSKEYHTGSSIGYKIGTWEPMFLYEYSWRDGLPLAHSDWDSWSIILPTSLQLHQVIFNQKIRLFQNIRTEITGKAVITDTSQSQFAGKIFIQAILPHITFGINLALSEGDYIHNDWKYSKYLWNTSGTILWQYYTHAYIKLKAEVAEYNYRTKETGFPDTLRQIYSVLWKQKFEFFQFDMYMQPESTLIYSYTESGEYFRTKVDFDYGIASWIISISNSIYWNLDKREKELQRLDINSKLKLEKKINSYPLALWIAHEWIYKKYIEYPLVYDDNDILYNSTDFITTLGGRLYHKNVGVNVALSYLCNNKSHGIGVYEYEFEFEISVRYKW